jgi:diaminopimelate decarboxylase
VHQALPSVHTLYFEPGRSLTQDGEILISRVLDVRDTRSEPCSEIVVDACIAELPLAQSFSHRIFYLPRSAGTTQRDATLLGRGKTRILGRICMEDDVLSSGVNFSENQEPKVGDYIIFADAGGYERTMSYVFGRG